MSRKTLNYGATSCTRVSAKNRTGILFCVFCIYLCGVTACDRATIGSNFCGYRCGREQNTYVSAKPTQQECWRRSSDSVETKKRTTTTSPMSISYRYKRVRSDKKWKLLTQCPLLATSGDIFIQLLFGMQLIATDFGSSPQTARTVTICFVLRKIHCPK